MNQNLSHISDRSVCITKRQLRDYVSGAISDEECHALEHHVNGCPLCSDALDGALMHRPEETLTVASHLNGDFLKAHFGLSHPQLHLNSMGPSLKAGTVRHRVQPWLRTSLIVALAVGTAVMLLLQVVKGNIH